MARSFFFIIRPCAVLLSSLVTPGGGWPSPGFPRDQDNALRFAKQEWQNTYHNGSYTTLLMLDFLIKRRGITYSDYLRNRDLILDKKDLIAYKARIRRLAAEEDKRAVDGEFAHTHKWLGQFPDKDFDSIIDNGTGRCTSFAIQISRALEQKHKNTYDFRFYRLGIHHLARCSRTEIVIDSTTPPFRLRPYETFRISAETDAYHRTWQFSPPDSSLLSKQHEGKEEDGQLYQDESVNWRNAIQYCLVDVAIKDYILLFFRTCPPGGTMAHHGLIKFLVQDKLEMHLTKQKDDPGVRIVFGEGSDDDESLCREILEGFIARFGGRNTAEDPEYQKCASVVKEIWQAGKEVYGQPRLKYGLK
ncbi:hypothetical protein GQ53DRAFT_756599 [Thozetella sp. PMI_491]|nr:hypothetical protein GQ53DRAFT_756599 [Thozetella sp. PMI_491]